MKITFVYADLCPADPHWPGYFSTGVGILSSVLKRAGHQTGLIHVVNPAMRGEEFLARVESQKPDLLGFSVTTNGFKIVRRLALRVRQAYPDLPVVCGGIHPTLDPEGVIATPGIEILCRGEGEEALLELVDCLEAGRDHTRIRNLWVRRGETIHRNPIRPLIQDLDALPFPDREIFDYKNLDFAREGCAAILATRGCPFRCTYCANHALQEIYRGCGRYVRRNGVEHVIGEMEDVIQRFPFIRAFNFDDDLPFVKQDWTEAFCAEYRKRIGLPFWFNARPNLTKEECLRMLRDAGATTVRIGLESGNEHILNEVLNRNLTVAQTEQAFRVCRRLGYKTLSFSMVGIPGETPANVLDTIKLNARVQTDVMQVSVLYPYPGTRMYAVCQDKGYMTGRVPDDYFSDSALQLDTLTPAQIRFFHDRFWHLAWLYRGAMRGAADGDGWRVRFLDRTLTYEPTCRLWGIVLAVAVPLWHLAKKMRWGDKVKDAWRATGVW